MERLPSETKTEVNVMRKDTTYTSTGTMAKEEAHHA